MPAIASARPPTRARAKKVALAWLRAAAKRKVPASSGPAITIAVHIEACTGHWDRVDGAALDCVAQALAHARLSAHWTSERAGNARIVAADLDTDGLRLEVDLTVDAAGHVTAVDFGEAEVVEGF